MRASKSMVGPVESILHWSGGPVGWKCQFQPLPWGYLHSKYVQNIIPNKALSWMEFKFIKHVP